MPSISLKLTDNVSPALRASGSVKVQLDSELLTPKLNVGNVNWLGKNPEPLSRLNTILSVGPPAAPFDCPDIPAVTR